MAWTIFKEIPWAFGNWHLLAHALTIRYTNNGNYFTVLLRYLHSSGSYSTLESDINLTSDFDYNKYRYRISLKNASSFGSVTHETKPTNGDFVASDTFNATINYTGVTILVEREEKNTAPTTPGVFTQPTTGTLEIGDSKTISWGASSVKLYILEVSLNNGAWTKIATLTSNNFTYTIPTATSIRFRVKAQDATGLESAYRESSTFTVQPPKYYWSKYNVTQKVYYTESAWWSDGNQNGANFSALFKNYSFDSTTGSYSGTGGQWGTDNAAISSVGYTMSGSTLYRFTVIGDAYYKIDVRSGVSQIADVKGSLIQSGIIASEGTYPTDGKHSDGFWYVRGSLVNQSIAPPQVITSPAADTVFRPGNTVSIAFTASTATNISAYEVDYRYNNGTWTPLATNATLTRTLTVTTDSTKTTLEFRIRAKNTSNVYSDYIYSPIYTLQHNVAPVVTLNTENNKTLYENDSFEIAGTVQDVDNGNTVTVRYQISGSTERAIKAYLSNGSVEPFSKTLIFKGGKLYDGETLIARDLVDSTPYTLQVWATDDKGGKSVIAERTFYVVPNRTPALTVNTPVIVGNIDSDKFEISGSYNDLDNNTTNVTYRINGGSSVQVVSGTNGDFNFKLKLGQLQVGLNSIVIEAIDSYGAKTSRTVKLEKNEVKTEQLKSTVRYKIIPPLAKAKGVILWVRRDKHLTLSASISMTQLNEAEDFVPMIKSVTAPISNQTDVVEDQFEYESTVEVDNIILQLDMQRSSLTADEKIYLLLGVID